MTQVLIGTDPELFAFDPLGDRFVSGHDMIPGTKQDPHPVTDGYIQVDGVACEFNTNPADSAEEFLSYTRSVMNELQEMVAPFGVTLVTVPTATFDKDYFLSLPAKVRELGCTPDYNAYTGKENDPPGTDEPFRTGAGHIHIGWTRFANPNDPDHFEMCRNVVKQLDAVIYPTSLNWDADDKRRTLYGKMGSFRPKSYGVEYRPLSNAYLGNDDIIKWVFNASKRCAELMLDENVKLWAEEDTSDTWYLNKRYGMPVLEV
jgi:hypothetical protein